MLNVGSGLWIVDGSYYVCGNSCLMSTNSRLVLPHTPSPSTSTLRTILPPSREDELLPIKPHSVIVVADVPFVRLSMRGQSSPCSRMYLAEQKKRALLWYACVRRVKTVSMVLVTMMVLLKICQWRCGVFPEKVLFSCKVGTRAMLNLAAYLCRAQSVGLCSTVLYHRLRGAR